MNKHRSLCVNSTCTNEVIEGNACCSVCTLQFNSVRASPINIEIKSSETSSALASMYPKYYKDVSHLSTIDAYAVHHLFNVQDPSGAIQHASKKLLLSGVRTGGKTMYQDIKEARDTLNRWLELNPPQI